MLHFTAYTIEQPVKRRTPPKYKPLKKASSIVYGHIDKFPVGRVFKNRVAAWKAGKFLFVFAKNQVFIGNISGVSVVISMMVQNPLCLLMPSLMKTQIKVTESFTVGQEEATSKAMLVAMVP